jgi:hypothetical protein
MTSGSGDTLDARDSEFGNAPGDAHGKFWKPLASSSGTSQELVFLSTMHLLDASLLDHGNGLVFLALNHYGTVFTCFLCNKVSGFKVPMAQWPNGPMAKAQDLHLELAAGC